jgi:DNA-binding response OmpR family regulator
MRVLLIEDDIPIQELLRAYFEAKGHCVSTAADGVEGLKAFGAGLPELVLLDVGLPRLDGWAVLEAIRSTSTVPVVLLTALDDTEDVVRGLAMGADDYLTKPFDVRELDARAQAILRRLEAPESHASLDVGDIHTYRRSQQDRDGRGIVPVSIAQGIQSAPLAGERAGTCILQRRDHRPPVAGQRPRRCQRC